MAKIGDTFDNGFGTITITGNLGERSKKGFWECTCFCGNTFTARADRLKAGVTKSCGCKKAYNPHNKMDLTGQTFGNLKVLKQDHIENGKNYYECECLLCGNKVVVRGTHLMNGHTTCCGCSRTRADKEGFIKLKKRKES